MHRNHRFQQQYRRAMLIYAVLACIFFTAAIIAAQDNEIDLTRLPLGDDKASTEPKVGYLWACQPTLSGVGGAFADGPWIDTAAGTWNRLDKITVDGEVEWPNYRFSIAVQGDERVFTGNGLPDHPTGIYPVQSSDDAYNYDRNPNTITEQTLEFALPTNPTLAEQTSCVGGVAGIAVNGVPIFNGFDALGRDAAAHEIQDRCGGHPEVTGQYHYHDLSDCIEERTETPTHSELVGYALDGFGIYGFRSEGGVFVTNEDLDECHGHIHEVEWDGQIVEMYHYHATAEFPYTVGCLRGTPANVQFGGAPGGQQGGPAGQGGPGQQPPGGQGGQPPAPPPTPPRR